MRAFHENDLIHGDLREPDFLCNGEAGMTVDLDWVGKVGEACYPGAQLRCELTIGRDSSDPKITKDDDRRILYYFPTCILVGEAYNLLLGRN